MHTARLEFSRISLALELDLDQLTERVAEFRKQREQMRREHIASANDFGHRTQNAPNSANKRFFFKSSRIMAFLVVAALAMVFAQVGWIIWGQEPGGRVIPSDTIDSRYTNSLKSPTTNNLEAQVSSLAAKMAVLSGLITNLESKLIATDKLEERISILTNNLQLLSRLTTDLESKQMAADKLEERISTMTKELQILSDLAADLKSNQMAAFATTTPFFPVKQELISRTNPALLTVAKEMPAIETKWASVPAIPDPKPATDSQTSMRETVRTLPEERRDMAALATTATVVPVKQELVSKTNPELPTESKKAPAIETKWASLPATPDPKPVTDGQTSKRETVRTLPRERRDNDVNKQPADSVPKNGPWTINLISSPDKSYAVDFSNTAQSKGVKTELQEVSLKGTPYWRVQVSGFSTQGEAKAYADNVKDKLGLTATWIMRR